ncbi:hypothetical protein ZWY2020_011513 [Hordeum vulgare]|nr:hypothetical protein ZWY2020_011513 [Hordeum vulgare]
MAMRRLPCSILPQWRIWRRREQPWGENNRLLVKKHVTWEREAKEEKGASGGWPWWGRREPAVRRIP